MQITLPSSLAAFIDEEVSSGRFSSPEQLIEAAVANLRLERDLEQNWDQPDIEELRSELEKGIAQADRGELAAWDSQEIMREVERRYAEEQKSKGTR